MSQQEQQCQRSLSLQCWDACLHYELARAEIWSQLKNSDLFENDWMSGDTLLSIEDKTCMMALHHIAFDSLGFTSEVNIRNFLQDFKKKKNKHFTDMKDDRISMDMFISLLESVKLVSNAVNILHTLWGTLLQMEELLVKCIIDESNTRTALEVKQRELREELFSFARQWEYAERLQEQLEQRVYLSTLHTVATREGRRRGCIDNDDNNDNNNDNNAIAVDRRKISRIREALHPDGEKQQQLTQQTLQIKRLSHLCEQLEILHEELHVAQMYETLSLEQIRREEFNQFVQLCKEESKKLQYDDQLSRMEQQLGIIGRFVIGLSVSTLGRKGHDAILQQMRNQKTADISIANTDIHISSDPNNHSITNDFTWLVKCDTDDNSHYCVSSIITTSQPFSLLQQQCVLDPSCYKSLDTVEVSTHHEGNVFNTPMRNVEEEDSTVEKALHRTFDSLVRLNHMELSDVFQRISNQQEEEKEKEKLKESSQYEKVSIPNDVVLFPSFLIFITCCDLHVIGSPALAFARHCRPCIDPNFAEKMKSHHSYQGNEWIADQAMNYNDFCAFLMDQASLEYVRDAFLFTPNALLKRIVINIIIPKWLNEVKAQTVTNKKDNLGEMNSLNSSTMKLHCSNDLCVLLDTAVSWLQMNMCTVKDFALAYKKYVLEYKCSIKPDEGRCSFTTTPVLLALLFPSSLSSSLLLLLGVEESTKKRIEGMHINCDISRLEVLRRSCGHAFLEASQIVSDDGSLDGVTAWLSVGVTSINRDKLMQRVSAAIKDILCFNFEEGIYYDNDLLPNGEGDIISYHTPISWILLLAVCVKLSFDDSVSVGKLDELFGLLIVS
ncbi:uncharacterized protein TM35_000201230 [Trypanosoma theileri]|uniref:Uncharacterized protein n=1 Tax=Trypanosoma theileri TaxID=67003 RepID=A0A1X0NSN9_9TRYP|nr:uncharacterized protein TM35_000201230 [Trypanosoma theileri]ORC87714.1 hypothetical protein TM35_000201230 [Trypanosoma theileri]